MMNDELEVADKHSFLNSSFIIIKILAQRTLKMGFRCSNQGIFF